MLAKNLQLTITWMVLASLLTLAAFWQAQSAITRDAEARHRSPPPPVKTRHAIRPVVAPWSGDVVADYIARCEKGMTDQEIRWVVEDFQNAGLDNVHPWDNFLKAGIGSSPSPTELESFEIYTATQQRWYRSTLVDGFRLSHDQSVQLTRSLDELLKKSQSEFIDGLVHGVPPIPNQLRGEWVETMPDWSSFFLSRPEAHPWKLCTLTSQQEKLTYKAYYDIWDNQTAGSPDNPALPDMRQLSSQTPGLSFLGSSPLDQVSPYSIREAGKVFPFLAIQKIIPASAEENPFVEIPAPSLENLRRLHPAQLKSLLLFSPETATKIQHALDAETR